MIAEKIRINHLQLFTTNMSYDASNGQIDSSSNPFLERHRTPSRDYTSGVNGQLSSLSQALGVAAPDGFADSAKQPRLATAASTLKSAKAGPIIKRGEKRVREFYATLSNSKKVRFG